MISPAFKNEIENILSEKLKGDAVISGLQSVGGGCINNAFKLSTNLGPFFIKWNDADRYPEMFESEAKGLQLLHESNSVYIPEVIANGKFENTSFLILEWVEAGKRPKTFWQDFGSTLARLHESTSQNFGLDHDNYIGSLPQSNKQHKTWIDFFISERIEPQLSLANKSGVINSSLLKKFDNLFHKLPQIIPEEKPSLLHGDLWNGNFMTAPDGTVCLIDPAVYYGHREMDLAMTKLFGGFDREFYESCHQAHPLTKGFDSRVDIHNLYPLLVHVNLFGGGYVQLVNSILNKF